MGDVVDGRRRRVALRLRSGFGTVYSYIYDTHSVSSYIHTVYSYIHSVYSYVYDTHLGGREDEAAHGVPVELVRHRCLVPGVTGVPRS